MQAVILIAGIAATYATMRTQSINNARELANMTKRVGRLEKEFANFLSRAEAEAHYVTKVELALTIENVDIKLKHIEKNQGEMLEILKKRGN